MDTANCTFCKRQITFGMIGGRLKVTHRLPHCQKFASLPPVDFLKQSVDRICSNVNKQLRLAIN